MDRTESEASPVVQSVSPGIDTTEYRVTKWVMALGMFLVALGGAVESLVTAGYFPGAPWPGVALAIVGALVAFIKGTTYSNRRHDLKLAAMESHSDLVRAEMSSLADGSAALERASSMLTPRSNEVSGLQAHLPMLASSLGERVQAATDLQTHGVLKSADDFVYFVEHGHIPPAASQVDAFRGILAKQESAPSPVETEEQRTAREDMEVGADLSKA